MFYIDNKYVNICGSNLRNFKRKSDTLYNCSCPLCGDSNKNKNKARGYFIKKSNSFYYHCHNCGISLSLGNFLKKQFPLFYQEYIFEKYKNKTEDIPMIAPVAQSIYKKMHNTHAINIVDLPDNHFAKEYVTSRSIPKSVFGLLYYTEDYASLVEELFPGKYTKLPTEDCRLVIPFFNSDGDVVGLQGRTLNNNPLRYITQKANDDVDLVYGVERVDFNKLVFVVEGPIDSLFLPNAIATANSDLGKVLRVFPHLKSYILVFDNEPRNKEIVKQMEKSIDSGHTICIWPSNVLEKDINDLIKTGLTPSRISDIIKNCAVSGLRAKMRLAEWRKC